MINDKLHALSAGVETGGGIEYSVYNEDCIKRA